MKARDWDAWQVASLPLVPAGSWNINTLRSVLPDSFFYHPTSSLLAVNNVQTIPLSMWNQIPHIEGLVTIKTNYQPSSKQNMEISYPRNEERYKFTEILRKWASKAVVPSNLADFQEKVGCPKLFVHC